MLDWPISSQESIVVTATDGPALVKRVRC